MMIVVAQDAGGAMGISVIVVMVAMVAIAARAKFTTLPTVQVVHQDVQPISATVYFNGSSFARKR